MKSFDDIVEFHGHACPGLALGYRVSLRALKEMKGRAVDEEVVAIVENNSCAVDAVQVMTGCTFGKGNLIFRDFGKQVYTFIRRPSGISVRIAVDWKKPPETKKERDLWEEYRRGDRSPAVMRFVHDRKAGRIAQILNVTDRDLMRVTKGISEVPKEAGIYQSIICAACHEKMMEPRARLRDGKIVCIPCSEKG